jgi:hypothetical protein
MNPGIARGVPGLRAALGVFAGSAFVCFAAPRAAYARSVSEAKRKRIEKAYAEFRKKGDIPGEGAPTIPWERALKFESRYYRIRTNTSRDVATYIGTLMDAQAVALRKIFQFRMNLKKINIWATRTRQDFVQAAFQDLRVRIGPSTGGFWTTARGGTICLPYVKAGNLHPGNVMMHEATHQFLHAALGRDMPIWLNEGLAVLFEESRYNPVTRKLEVFIVPRMRLRVLQHEMKRGSHVRLPALFSTPQMMFNARYYGAAWSFIYWIFRSSGADNKEALRRQKAFNKYLYDVKAKKKGVARLFNYLGMNLEEVEREWKTWVLKLDPDDERGGTRFKGEPPYEPKPKTADDEGDARGGPSSRGGDMPDSMRRRLEQMLRDPKLPESMKDKIRERLEEGSAPGR